MAPRSPRWCTLVLIAAAPLPAAAGTIHGTVVDTSTGEPVIGATIAAVGPALEGSAAAVSDETGAYSLEVPAGTYMVTVYYSELEVARPDIVVPDVPEGGVDLPLTIESVLARGETIVLNDALGVSDYGQQYYGQYYVDSYIVEPAPIFDRTPTWRTTTADDVPLLWRRDHAGLDALDARLDPTRATTVLDHAIRLPGAPPIALELLDTQRSYASHAPIDLAGASGGVQAVALLHGTDEWAGEVRTALGRTGRYSATLRGPLSKGDAWSSGGVVLDQTPAGLLIQAVSSINFEVDDDHTGDLSMVNSEGPGEASAAWVQTHGTSRSEDGKRAVEIGLVGEVIDVGPIAALRVVDGVAAPRKVSRFGGELILFQRGRLHGDHELVVGGEVGGGEADDLEHTDVRAFAGDTWQVEPGVVLDAGARWDRRVIGETSVELLSPRVSLSWDPSKKGRTMVFAGAERSGRLDERSFGAWRNGSTYRDTAVTGLAHVWRRVRMIAAMRGRLPPAAGRDRLEVGFEGSARIEPDNQKWMAEATVSTLDRTATLLAGWSCACDKTTFHVAAIARATPEDVAWGATLFARRHPSEDSWAPTLSYGLEALDLDDPARRSAHLVLTGGW